MRHLAQLFYFLGSFPGLRFLSRIGGNLSRLGAFASSAKAAKVSLNNVQGKNNAAKGKTEDTQSTEESK